MVDEQGAGDGRPEAESVKGWERRSGKERRKAERRGIDVPVAKDRRSGWDRRKGDERRSG